jgi:hypothetical protein
MDHFAFPSIDVFVEKHNRYSNWEARLEIQEETTVSETTIQHTAVGLRRNLKRWSRSLPLRPTLRFLYVYVFQRGFLDGSRGLTFARLHAMYEFLSIAKAAELRLSRSALADLATPLPIRSAKARPRQLA